MNPVVDELVDLQYNADSLVEAGDVAGAEAALRRALALVTEQRAPSDEVRTEQQAIAVALADVLLRRDILDEAEAILLAAAARPTTPSRAIRIRHRLSDLAGRRGDPDRAAQWSSEAFALSAPESLHAPSVTIEAVNDIVFAARHLGSCLATQRRATEATEIEVVAGAARRALLAEFFRARDTGPTTELARIVGDIDIRYLSSGEVTSNQTVDPEGKPVRGGLRCAQTFGPVVDFTCTCGRYAAAAHVGTVCERCGVEVISARAREGRFGQLSLGMSVLHPRWASRVLARCRMTRDAFLQADEARIAMIEADLVRNASTRLDPGMLIAYLPVWPPDAPLPVDRALVDRSYGAILDARGDRPALQRAVDQLFALFDRP